MGIKAAMHALIGPTPKKKSQQSEASEAAAEARLLKKRERERSSFFGQLKELEEFKQTLRVGIIEDETAKIVAVEQAHAGWIEAQQQEELIGMGFHPDSTSNERVGMQMLNLLSHHLSPWTAPKNQKGAQDPMGSTNQTPPPESSASLEELATLPDQLPPPPPPPGNQTATQEVPQPGNVDQIMSFLNTMGLTKEQLASWGIFPEKIDPSRMSMGWAKNAAALVRQLQVE